MKKLLTAFIALVFVISCSKDGGFKGSYVAKVGGKTLTKEDVQAEMNTVPDMAKAFFQGPEGMGRFMDELVKKEMLYLEAQKRGLDKSKEFQKKVEEFKKITLINQLLEKEIEAASKFTDKDVTDYYEKHKEDFMVNSRMRLSHILVKDEADAKKVYERLQKGEDFAKIASDASIDKATAKSGGDIGMFKRGDMRPELEEAAFRLKKGQVSVPIKLKDGIHIIKVTDAKGSVMEFDKVKGFVRQKMTAERQRETFDKFIENLKKSYKIDINKDALSKLTFAPAPQPAPAQTPEKK